MKNLKLNEQEIFWKKGFGNNYIGRNTYKQLLKSKINLFKQVFKKIKKPKSIFEIGCNIGLNLQAINKISPKILLHGIDINEKAINTLKKKNIFSKKVP